jgi:AraC family transcriptional regulator of adaptative response/methylated-DNA-[protein]-cysteine methyltransferase
VRTTGIFCRPGCPARPAKPANLEYFPGPAEALAAGFRPCRRCRPLDPAGQPPWMAALLAEVAADPGLRLRDRDLADRGLDPGTVRRHFQKNFGLSFQAWLRARRLAAAREELRAGASVDDAVFASGYGSHSGFREAFTRAFGKPPGRAEGTGCISLGWIASPLGPLLAGATDAGICLLCFADPGSLDQQARSLARRHALPLVPGGHPHLDRLERELEEYFAGRRRAFTLPLAPAGTPFQERVWKALEKIPYGETRSYEDIARALGDRRAVRAVGSANGQNRILILIPCHRVVNKDGRLGGYAGGLRRKEFLLALERDRGIESR